MEHAAHPLPLLRRRLIGRVAILLFVTLPTARAHSQDEELRFLRYQQMLQLIEQHYVDERRVTHLFDSIMEAVMRNLDPHTYYLNPAEYHRQYGLYQGKDGRFGIRLYENQNGTFVYMIEMPSPASDAGLMPGDKVVAVNRVPITELGGAELRRMMNEYTVQLTVTRKKQERLTFDLKQESLPNVSVYAPAMLDSMTGYIYVEGFVASTASEVLQALKDLRAQGMQQLILDLRDNGGGLAQPALAVAGLFLEEGKPLLAYSSRHERDTVYYTTTSRGEFADLPLMILVDNNTASASEILSGILQDHDRGVLIGQPTYGKGLAQSQYRLRDGGALHLTVARFLLPSGRWIQRAYHGAEYLAYSNLLPDGDNQAHALDTSIPTTGAFRTIRGRTVYAGQGLMPEVLVNRDTMLPLLRALVDSGAIDIALDRYLQHNAERLFKRFDAERFDREFTIAPDLLPHVVKAARECQVNATPRQIEKQRDSLLVYLKQHLSYRLFGYEGWVRTVFIRDRQVRKALELSNQSVLVMN